MFLNKYKPIFVFIFICVSVSSHAQIIELNKPSAWNVKLGFENTCTGDTVKRNVKIIGATRKSILYGYYCNNPDIKCYINDKGIKHEERHLLERKSKLKVVYSPSNNKKEVAEIRFNIKKGDKINKVRIKALLYSFVFTKSKLNKIDTLRIDKKSNCLSHHYIYLPNLGTTTCINVSKNDSSIYQNCFNSTEKVLFEFEKLKTGNYDMVIIGDFYKKKLILIVEE